MRAGSPQNLLVFALALTVGLCSCKRDRDAQQAGVAEPAAKEERAAVEPARTLERISVSEIGKLRSRLGKEVLVYGKVSGTSTSSSGHHFLNFTSGFKIVCLQADVASFGRGGPAELYRGELVEVTGEMQTHKGRPQITIQSPQQVAVIDLSKGKGGGGASAQPFELLEVGTNIWVSPAGLRYRGRDAKGLTRKDHVLRHAKDQPTRAGSHGVFDAEGMEVFRVVDLAWEKIENENIRPQVEGDSETYLVPMGKRVGFLGGQTGARRKNPSLASVFIVVRKGTNEVITAFPR